jgi:thiamine biosynthesis lipoprotein
MMRARFRAMGTVISLLLPSRRAADVAGVERVFGIWEQTLSRFQPDSELSHLNRHTGEPVMVSNLLLDVIKTSLDAARATGGLFDPTLLHNMVSLGYNRSFEQLEPAPLETEWTARPGGGWRQIQVDAAHRTVTLPDGVGLDLGGIAKGMAVDTALLHLKTEGAGSALVNAGGDLAVHGLPPGMDAWPIALQGRDAAYNIPLRQGAMATSGISRRRWQQGPVTRHHLLAPWTGLPVSNGLWSVTVVAGTCGQAEVTAKAAFALGPVAGQHFIQDCGCSGLLIRENGTWQAAGRWPVAMMKVHP